MRDAMQQIPGNGDPALLLRGLRVVVVSCRSPGDRDFEAVRPAAVVPPEQALRELAGSPDVWLVDVRDGSQLPLVARLTQGGLRAVVVLGGAPGVEAVPYLDAGAADYVPLGITAGELAARLRAAARRNGSPPQEDDDAIVIGDVSISVARHEVRRAGELVPLTPHEFQLLETLASTPDETVPHHKLMVRVWGVENTTSRHYLRIYVRQLRRKLEVDPEAPTLIVTEWGRGYRLCTDATR